MQESNFNPFNLSGKHILVTGASSGIGRAICVACSKMGATLYLTARNRERLKETCNQLIGKGHQIIPADLSKKEDINSLVEALPKLDGIVQNAGVGSRVLCKSITDTDIDNVFIPNLQAPILLQTALLNHKKINKNASVLFIASRAAEAPSIGNAVYSASKGAIISYAKVLALELASRLIRVNCICPAMVWTELILQGGLAKEDLEKAQLKYPLKRYGQPEDIAYLAIYLLSDASSWMTGECINLTGGGEGTLTL